MYIRRKVYSALDDFDYGYYDEPSLYSVTMDEDELSLFSNFCDGYYEALYSDDDDHEVAKGAAIGALTAAGITGVGYGADKLTYAAKIRRLNHKTNRLIEKKGDPAKIEKLRKARVDMLNRKETTAERWAENTSNSLKKLAGAIGKYPSEWAEKGANKLKGGNWASQKTKAALEAIAKNPRTTGAILAAAGATGIGAGVGYGVKKHREND